MAMTMAMTMTNDDEAGTAHDFMQVPTSVTGHEEEAQAAATGHEEEAQAAATGNEEAQSTATGQEKKSAATGDNEQALAEAQSSATGQRRKDDKPLLDPPEIDDETGPIWDNGHRRGEEVCSHRR